MLPAESNRKINQNVAIRYGLAKNSTIVIASATVVALSLAPITGLDTIFTSLTVILFAALTVFGLKRTRHDYFSFVLFCLLTAFIWVAYFFKFSLILHNPTLIWNAGGIMGTDDSIVDSILPIFYGIVPALLLFTIGFLVAPRIKDGKRKSVNTYPDYASPVGIVVCAFGILIVKLIGQLFFNVGSPIEDGTGLPPLILALYEFLVQDVFIVLLNVLFFTCLVIGNKTLTKILSFCLLVNVLMSLSVGYKYEMVTQAFALVYYLYEFRFQLSRKKRIRLTVVSLLTIAGMLLAYPYINPLRHALKNDISTAEAVNSIYEQSRYNSVESDTGATLLFSRISGIGTYYSSVILGESVEFGPTALLTNQLSLHLKWSVFGDLADQVKVGFGASQFSALYLVGGVGLLLIGSFVYGFLIRFFSKILSNKLVFYHSTMQAFIPFLSFFWISFLLAGGNFSLLSKKLFVMIVGIYVIEKIFLGVEDRKEKFV